jgi:hypothetical protein
MCWVRDNGPILDVSLVPWALGHDLRRGILSPHNKRCPPMTDIITKPNTKDEIKVERPRLHKVILINDDFTRASSSSRF